MPCRRVHERGERDALDPVDDVCHLGLVDRTPLFEIPVDQVGVMCDLVAALGDLQKRLRSVFSLNVVRPWKNSLLMQPAASYQTFFSVTSSSTPAILPGCWEGLDGELVTQVFQDRLGERDLTPPHCLDLVQRQLVFAQLGRHRGTVLQRQFSDPAQHLLVQPVVEGGDGLETAIRSPRSLFATLCRSTIAEPPGGRVKPECAPWAKVTETVPSVSGTRTLHAVPAPCRRPGSAEAAREEDRMDGDAVRLTSSCTVSGEASSS